MSETWTYINAGTDNPSEDGAIAAIRADERKRYEALAEYIEWLQIDLGDLRERVAEAIKGAPVTPMREMEDLEAYIAVVWLAYADAAIATYEAARAEDREAIIERMQLAINTVHVTTGRDDPLAEARAAYEAGWDAAIDA